MSHKKSPAERLQQFKETHGTTYDYSKSDIKDRTTKIEIICKIHGSFWQSPAKHISGRGCPQCANSIRGNYHKLTTEDFIKRANNIHNNRY